MEELDIRVARLEEQNKNQNGNIKTIFNKIEGIRVDIQHIKDKLLGRPAWIVVFMITGLATVCGSLIVFIITKGGLNS